MDQSETFWDLLTNLAHWEFELFLIFIFDVLIALILLPIFKKWVLHHKTDDQKMEDLEQRIKLLEESKG